MQNLFVHPVFVAFAFIIMLVMSIRLNKKLIPLSPILAMGMVVFVSAGRFAIYLIPFIGAAYGYLIAYTINILKIRSAIKTGISYVAVAIMLVAFTMLSNPMGGILFYFTPGQSITPPMLNTFKLLKERLTEGSSV
jgi:dolichyl-diphosphooligosaccharide--protein glycosyltransferase